MDKILERARKIAVTFSNEFSSVLSGVYLYGSAARGEYLPRHSDLNFLLVFNRLGREELKKISAFQNKFGAKVSLICLTEDFIDSSLDTFPLELLDMKLHHLTLVGKDILAGLQIATEHLRLQCERELKAKLSLLRQGLITHGCKEKELCSLIIQHLPALTAIFQGIIFLRHGEAPENRRELYDKAVEELGIPKDLMSDLKSIKEKGRFRFGAKTEDLFFRLIEAVERLSQEVDIMDSVKKR